MTETFLDSASQPLVSIIVPTFNSEKTLDLCLSSISEQTFGNIETIVIDNLSQDRTVEIAKKHCVKTFQYSAERSAARNFGFSKSRGRFVLFLDSDMELAYDAIQQCVSVAQSNQRLGGIVIPERSVGKSFWVKVRNFEKSFYKGTYVESARFFPSELVRSASGYDENVTFYEESTLPCKIEKLGYSVKYRADTEICHHEDNFSLKVWLIKKYYYGKTASTYTSSYNCYANQQFSLIFRLRLFLSSKRFYSKLSLMSSILFLKFLESLAVYSGFIVGVVKKL